MTVTVSMWGLSLLGPVDPSFRALSRRLKFTVQRHKVNKDSLWGLLRPDDAPCWPPRGEGFEPSLFLYPSGFFFSLKPLYVLALNTSVSLEFEPSLDALNLRSTVISSIKILFGGQRFSLGVTSARRRVLASEGRGIRVASLLGWAIRHK
jgi:hypothetical protein